MRTHHLILNAAFLSLGALAFATGAIAQTAPQICGPEETERSPQVCFYTEVDFGGHYFCESGCRTVNQVSERWRDSIKSIEVRDGASVQICSEFSRDGDCQNISMNYRELGPELFNHVYSYRTKD